MKPVVSAILVKSAIATAASIAMSVALCFIILTAFGHRMDGFAWIMAITCPLVIAWPASAWQFWQQQRLSDANAEIIRMNARLEQMHRELEATHAALGEKARRDGLTGVLNRESFFAAVAEARTGSTPGTLLVIDVDHFKAVNDGFGHLAGDQVLRAVSAAIRSALRGRDLFGRIGGEEFAAFLQAAEVNEIRDLAEGVRNAVANHDFATEDGHAIRLTISIGGAADRPAYSLNDLFTEADRRLYKAKQLGRNRTIIDPDIFAVA